ncbi:MAG: hypothetical protein PVG71_00370 [Anaerolineae bacterium]|jgi:hypothetical protein
MREDTAAKTASPRSVIGCLAAGFEMLGRNLWLVALPVVLDLFLWLGPRISLGPLLRRLAGLLENQSAADAEVSGQIAQATSLLEQFAARFNLLAVLGSMPLLHVPSLLARQAVGGASPLGEPHVFSLSSALALIPWWGGLVVAGLALGFLYLNEIAKQIEASRALSGDDPAQLIQDGTRDGNGSARTTMRKFLRFLLFAFGAMVTGFSVFSFWLLVVLMAAAIAQPLGVLLWVAGVGFMSYAALHLVFVVPGLLLGRRRLLQAVGESVTLSHINLSSVIGLLVLAVVIYEGLGYAWSLPASDSWAFLVGIVGNAVVATGLTGAAFLFYRDRLMVARRLLDDND